MKVTAQRHPDVVALPLLPMEVNVLLRALATANDAERTLPGDRQVNTWLAERLLRLRGESNDRK